MTKCHGCVYRDLTAGITAADDTPDETVAEADDAADVADETEAVISLACLGIWRPIASTATIHYNPIFEN